MATRPCILLLEKLETIHTVPTSLSKSFLSSAPLHSLPELPDSTVHPSANQRTDLSARSCSALPRSSYAENQCPWFCWLLLLGEIEICSLNSTGNRGAFEFIWSGRRSMWRSGFGGGPGQAGHSSPTIDWRWRPRRCAFIAAFGCLRHDDSM